MNQEEVLEAMQPLFNKVFDRDDLVITRETSAKDVEEWDSLAQIDLVVSMEKQFGIKFSLDELIELQNVGDAVDLIVFKQ
jgi:acyl carrier protein